MRSSNALTFSTDFSDFASDVQLFPKPSNFSREKNTRKQVDSSFKDDLICIHVFILLVFTSAFFRAKKSLNTVSHSWNGGSDAGPVMIADHKSRVSNLIKSYICLFVFIMPKTNYLSNGNSVCRYIWYYMIEEYVFLYLCQGPGHWPWIQKLFFE